MPAQPVRTKKEGPWVPAEADAGDRIWEKGEDKKKRPGKKQLTKN